MRIPQSTYRLQFNQDFTFESAQGIIDYLADFGVSDIYASPIFMARAGSAHGYDVVDPNQLNPELGTTADFDSLSAKVKERGMGWVQDIVPNHMAIDSNNSILMDVLEKGPDSQYFNFFDIEWDHPNESLKGKLLIPFLGKFYSEALESGEIKLDYDQNGLNISYYGLRLPLKIGSYPEGSGSEYAAALNGQPGNPESFDKLDKLLSEQNYRLSFWKVAAEEINYRRFFSINELICLKPQIPEVLDRTHELIFWYSGERKFTGLRIDHIDGLYDPLAYIKRIRERVGDVYLIAEKILDYKETLPKSWKIQGTSGYDFLNYVNALFCRKDAASKITKTYYKYTDLRTTNYDDLVAEKKRLIVNKHMAGNIDNLADMLKDIAQKDRYGKDLTFHGLQSALIEIMVQFPVYRTYVDKNNFSRRDQLFIEQAIDSALKKNPGLVYEFNFIKKYLLQEFGRNSNPDLGNRIIDFIMRFQQYTGPLMAKGFEDTLLYNYNKLISLNEVGGWPNRFGVTLREFENFNRKRARNFSSTLNATSTHDTKRGEDSRMRISVLSELPKDWKNSLKRWSRLNKAKKKNYDGCCAPDANDEYFIYQALLGSFPFFPEELDKFNERIKDYFVKAIREAKTHTAWIKPDTDYEEACIRFIEEILNPVKSYQFFKDFSQFAGKLSFYGIFNSLSQLLLKITCPGVPDFYQGTELWDLSLVDPDNRRPVDFEKRKIILSYIKQKESQDILALINELLSSREDGRVKLFLAYRALKARADNPEIFKDGSFIQLKIEGENKDSVVAFARRHQNSFAITVVPRFLASILREGELPLGEEFWGSTRLILLEGYPDSYIDAISGQPVSKNLSVGSILKYLPAVLLTARL